MKSLSLKPNELPSAKIGKPFPNFSLPDLHDSERVVTQRQLVGKVRLVNVWATWCPTCRQEHRFLNDLQATQHVEIIGINYKDDRAQAVQWLERYDNPYLFSIFDEKGRLGLDLGVYGAPETYVVDQQGIIRYRHVGEVNAQVWQVLKEKMQAFGWVAS